MASPEPHVPQEDEQDARLWQRAYDELHRLAGAYFRAQPSGHTLQPTAIVHEAFLKLSRAGDCAWRDETHFFRTAARAMRQILVDHARRRARANRAREHLSLELDATPTDSNRTVDLLALDEALERLTAHSPRESQVVELRFFGGLSVEQAADVLEVSRATVKRDWTYARAWLLEELDTSAEG